jgi:hypothetical protein
MRKLRQTAKLVRAAMIGDPLDGFAEDSPLFSSFSVGKDSFVFGSAAFPVPFPVVEEEAVVGLSLSETEGLFRRRRGDEVVVELAVVVFSSSTSLVTASASSIMCVI